MYGEIINEDDELQSEHITAQIRQVGWNIRNQQIQNISDDLVNISNSDDAETHQVNRKEIAELHKQLEL